MSAFWNESEIGAPSMPGRPGSWTSCWAKAYSVSAAARRITTPPSGATYHRLRGRDRSSRGCHVRAERLGGIVERDVEVGTLLIHRVRGHAGEREVEPHPIGGRLAHDRVPHAATIDVVVLAQRQTRLRRLELDRQVRRERLEFVPIADRPVRLDDDLGRFARAEDTEVGHGRGLLRQCGSGTRQPAQDDQQGDELSSIDHGFSSLRSSRRTSRRTVPYSSTSNTADCGWI